MNLNDKYFFSESIKSLETLQAVVSKHRSVAKGMSNLLSQIYYCMERIQDIQVIYERFESNIVERNKKDALFLQKVDEKKDDEARSLMISKREQITLLRLDVESMLLLASIALDHWAGICSYIFNYNQPQKSKFVQTVIQLSNDQNKMPQTLWNKNYKDMAWLYSQIKLFRNIFISHTSSPWQKTISYSILSDEFCFFYPTPTQLDFEDSYIDTIDSYFSQIHKKISFKIAKPSVLDKSKYVLQYLYLFDKGNWKSITDDCIKCGMNSVSPSLLLKRLSSFLRESLDTLTSYVKTNHQDINMGIETTIHL
jgi:hypothetical protein